MSYISNNDLLIKYLPFMQEIQQKWKMTEDCLSVCYTAFLEYDNEKLNTMNENGELKYFILGLMRNQWKSKHSYYYYQYVKPTMNWVEYDEV